MVTAACSFLITLLSFNNSSAQAVSNAQTVLHFSNWVGQQPLQLFDSTYKNQFGESFTVNKFRYYISKLILVDENGNKVPQPGCYLVNEEDEQSKSILVNAKGIRSLSFVIGVDSSLNANGVNTGSLDPMNGMFWTWNSGYIFAKLEGSSDQSSAPAHSFSWDVGGFRNHENALRTVELKVSDIAETINIHADISKWFEGLYPMKFSISPVCHEPGKLAMQLADNYSAMFSVVP